MKRIIKGLTAAAVLFVLLAVTIVPVFAATVEAHLEFSAKEVKVGEPFTLTAVYSSSAEVGTVGGTIRYDSAHLQFTGGNGCSAAAPGSLTISADGSSSNIVRVTARFKVIGGDGPSTITLNGCTASFADGEFKGAGAVLTIKPADASQSSSSSSTPSSKSGNADLKQLSAAAGALEPAFNPSVTDYTVTCPFDKTDGILYGQPADAKAKFSIDGNRELAVGLTQRTFTVTAQDGTTKVYTVTFNRLDENGRDVTKSDAFGEEVLIGDITYRLCKTLDGVNVPDCLVQSTCQYGTESVACLTDATGSQQILCLENTLTKERGLFCFDGLRFTPLLCLEYGDAAYIVCNDWDFFDAPAGFYPTVYELNGQTVNCAKYADAGHDDWIVLYATSVEGHTGYYRYDTKEGSIQRFDEFVNGVSVSADPVVSEKRLTLLAVLAVVAVELIIALIVLGCIWLAKRSKKRMEEDEPEYVVDEESDEP